MSDVEAKTAIETPLQVIHAEEKAAMDVALSAKSIARLSGRK